MKRKFGSVSLATKISMRPEPVKSAIENNPMTKNGTNGLMAGWDDMLGMRMGEARNDAMASLIDASRGKAPAFTPTGGIATMLALSHKHDDSMMMMMDY